MGVEFQRAAVVFSLTAILSGCAPFVPVLDTAKLSSAEQTAAANVQVFVLESAAQRPTVEKVLSRIEAYSCKHGLTDPPPSRGDALLQLQVKAVRLGANAVVDVTFDGAGTDAFGTNCWQSIHASGLAVLLGR